MHWYWPTGPERHLPQARALVSNIFSECTTGFSYGRRAAFAGSVGVKQSIRGLGAFLDSGQRIKHAGANVT
jgi:hypothetical protein